ncbi:MAG: ABC transporter permease [Ilumatobacter sp.]|uniref:ABC transporter permease n=1 Tax=Ilumatobacter sp. TaxID=1967498 RepID=UPI003296A779
MHTADAPTLTIDTTPDDVGPERAMADGHPPANRGALARRAWFAVWPKMAAIAIGVGAWQLIVWSGWRPEYVLPAPATVFQRLGELIADGTVATALTTTAERAGYGFTMALAIGVVTGGLVSSSRIIRSAVGSLITGLQTMPSIAWFPLAILLFGLSERAITFVVVLGAAPSIANGLITGVDHVPPVLLRAGRMMGATGYARFRHVVLPASMPSFVGGLKQGWAFAWRSLMAGELIVVLGVSVGFLLQQYRNLADATGLIAMMIVILVIGIVVDTALFGSLDRRVRRRHGLIED